MIITITRMIINEPLPCVRVCRVIVFFFQLYWARARVHTAPAINNKLGEPAKQRNEAEAVNLNSISLPSFQLPEFMCTVNFIDFKTMFRSKIRVTNTNILRGFFLS